MQDIGTAKPNPTQASEGKIYPYNEKKRLTTANSEPITDTQLPVFFLLECSSSI